MYLFMEAVDGRIRASMKDLEVFTAFSASAPGLTPGEIREGLESGSAGELAGNHVWVEKVFIESCAEVCATEGWKAGYRKMIAFAGEHGWVSDDGMKIRAHLEDSASGK